MTDHTRFFYPVGHGIKINHYFPNKNYHYQEMVKPESSKDSIPVYEEKELGMAKIDEPAIVVKDSAPDNALVAEMKETKETLTTPKAEVETVPINVVPAVVTMIAQNPEESKPNSENLLVPEEKTETQPLKAVVAIGDQQPKEKDDPNLDSEVASSYYHSKMYYVAY